MGVWYCSREDVKSALDFKETARNNAQVDRAIEAASRACEGLLHRRFYPQTGTRFFDWPNDQNAAPWRLWLDDNEVISVSQMTSGGVSISASDFFLEPANYGPPFNRIEIDLDSQSGFVGGTTHQRNIAVTGLFGYSNEEFPAGDVDEAMTSSETDMDVTNSAVIGVGNVLRVGSERLIVTEKTMKSTTQTLQTPMTASAADVSVAVTNGSGFFVGETVLLDSERMLIVDIAGNTLTVKRAWDGSVLATHTGSTIYAPRTLTVTRGALGTTAAAMSQGDDIVRWEVPGLLRELCIAEAANLMLQAAAGYARTAGGETPAEISVRGVVQLRDQAYTLLGRKARTRAV